MSESIQGEYRDFTSLTPVFIKGLWRSGTTLTQRLLDGHPELLIYPFELIDNSVYQARILPELFSIIQKGLSDQDANAIFSCLMEHYPGFSEAVNPPAHLKSKYLMRGLDPQDFLFYFSTALSSKAGPWDNSDILKAWMFSYFKLSGVNDFSNYKSWVIKFPSIRIPLSTYLTFFSNSRIIYIRRDPRGFWASEKHRAAAINRFQPYSGLVHLISDIYSYKLSCRQEKLAKASGIPMVRLRYENLVTNTEHEMRKIAAFLKIGFNPSLMIPTFFGIPWESNSTFNHQEAHRGFIHRQSIDHWKDAIGWHEKFLIESRLAKEMLSLRYIRMIHFQRLRNFLWRQCLHFAKRSPCHQNRITSARERRESTLDNNSVAY